jgi:O-antigen/teichoic acid export membrane protein
MTTPARKAGDHPPILDNPHREQVGRSLRESAIYLFSKLVPLVFNLLFIRLYTTWFAPEVVGRYETQLAIATVAASLAVGWLQMSLLRFYPTWRARGKGYVNRVLCVGFAVAVLMVGVLFLGGWWARDTPVGILLGWDLLAGAFALFFANAGFLLFSSLLRAERAAGKFALVSSSTSFLNTALVWALALVFGGILESLIGGTAGSLLLPALAAWALWGLGHRESGGTRELGATEARHSGSFAVRTLLLFGLPLAINQAAAQLLNLSDRYVILLVRGEAEAGIYSAVYRLADFAIRSVLLALMMSAYTAVTEVYESHGKAAAEKLVTSLSRFYLVAVAPLVVGLGLVQDDLMKVLAGEAFQEGSWLLVWIGLGNLLLGLSQYQHFGLHLGLKTGRLAAMTLAAALVNLGLNLWLVPRYGYPAAAFTTLFSFAGLAVAAPLLGRPWLVWRLPVSFLFRLAICLCGMAAVVAAAGLLSATPWIRLLLQIGIGGLSYSVLLFMVGEIPPTVKARLVSIWRSGR